MELKTEQSTEVGKLFTALAKAQGQLNGAAKSADNPFFKSKYADLYECIEAAKKPLSDNELAVVQTIEIDSNPGIIIATTIGHSSGQWIRGRIRMNPKKDDDQGRGSSITYGRRYAFAAIVGLAQKDDDGNASSGNRGGTPKKAEIITPDKIIEGIKFFVEHKKTAGELKKWVGDKRGVIIAFPEQDQERISEVEQEAIKQLGGK